MLMTRHYTCQYFPLNTLTKDGVVAAAGGGGAVNKDGAAAGCDSAGGGSAAAAAANKDVSTNKDAAEGGFPLEGEIDYVDPQELHLIHDPENPKIIKGG